MPLRCESRASKPDHRSFRDGFRQFVSAANIQILVNVALKPHKQQSRRRYAANGFAFVPPLRAVFLDGHRRVVETTVKVMRSSLTVRQRSIAPPRSLSSSFLPRAARQCIRLKRIPLATASDNNDSADAAAMPIPNGGDVREHPLRQCFSARHGGKRAAQTMLRSGKSYIALQKSGGVRRCRAAQIQQSRRPSVKPAALPFPIRAVFECSLRRASLGIRTGARLWSLAERPGPTGKAYNFAGSLSMADGLN